MVVVAVAVMVVVVAAVAVVAAAVAAVVVVPTVAHERIDNTPSCSAKSNAHAKEYDYLF
jgi:hypothetical protein